MLRIVCEGDPLLRFVSGADNVNIDNDVVPVDGKALITINDDSRKGKQLVELFYNYLKVVKTIHGVNI